MLTSFQQYIKTYKTSEFDVLFYSDTCIRVKRHSEVYEHVLTYHEPLTNKLKGIHPDVFSFKLITYLNGKEHDVSYHFVFPYGKNRHAYVSFDTFSHGKTVEKLKKSSYFLDESYDFLFNERYIETQPAEQFKEALLQLPEFRLLNATGLLQ